MDQPQDLFSLSFTTKPDAGDGGLDFLRPDTYTAEQVLAEAADLAVHPDNAHVESFEIRRTSHVDSAVTSVKPVPLNGNAYAGFAIEHWNFGDPIVKCTIIDHHKVAEKTLADLINDQRVERIKLYW